jgi:hypothetical protein
VARSNYAICQVVGGKYNQRVTFWYSYPELELPPKLRVIVGPVELDRAEEAQELVRLYQSLSNDLLHLLTK